MKAKKKKENKYHKYSEIHALHKSCPIEFIALNSADTLKVSCMCVAPLS